MKEPDNFDVLKTMCDRNKDIALAVDILNFDRKPKLKGGTITVGVADPHFTPPNQSGCNWKANSFCGTNDLQHRSI